jgi:hypothetical protein
LNTVPSCRFQLVYSPDTWSISQQTGRISGRFTASGSYSFEIRAIDKVGAVATLETIDFAVVEGPKIKLETSGVRAKTGKRFAVPGGGVAWVTNTDYRISPLVVDPLTSAGDALSPQLQLNGLFVCLPVA